MNSEPITADAVEVRDPDSVLSDAAIDALASLLVEAAMKEDVTT